MTKIRRRSAELHIGEIESFEPPGISIVVAAYNAGLHIEDRIHNLLSSDYPVDRFEIIVASDGSNDDTVARVRAMNLPSVRGLEYPQRSGKAATLVKGVKEARYGILVFTDATTRFLPSTLRALARPFANPSVGVVCGHAKMIDSEGRSAEGFYWKLENSIRRWESQLGILTGASGAVYGMRSEYFVPPGNPIINDDLVFPMLAKLTHECDFRLELAAIAEVQVAGDLRNEFRRRVRIGLGAFQALQALRSIYAWKHAAILSCFVSHKVLRWIGPLLLIGILASNIGLLSLSFYRLTMVIQLVCYGVGLLGGFLPKNSAWLSNHPHVSKCLMPIRLLSNFVIMNGAILVGFLQWFRTPTRVTWEPTKRPIATTN